MKRIKIYINGIKATMDDLSVLLGEHRDEILEVKRLSSGNITIKTI